MSYYEPLFLAVSSCEVFSSFLLGTKAAHDQLEHVTERAKYLLFSGQSSAYVVAVIEAVMQHLTFTLSKLYFLEQEIDM